MADVDAIAALLDRLQAPNSLNVVQAPAVGTAETLDDRIMRGGNEIDAMRRYEDEMAMHGRLAAGGVRFTGLPAAAGYNDIGLRRR